MGEEEVMDEEFNYGYEEGIREAEKHLVDPDEIGSINDQHIDEMNRMQDDYCKQIESLESRIKELEDGIQNVIDQKEPEDNKWVIGYLAQLLSPTGEK